MSEVALDRFTCEACDRSYAWKVELAGKRVKCKCGQVMTVPQNHAMAEPLEQDTYDIAPEPAPTAPKASPRVPLAPRASTPAPAAAAIAPLGAAPQALGYQSGPTAREKQRVSKETLVDMKRDVQVPAFLLLAGFAIYLGYYIFHYDLGGGGIVAASVGLCMMTAFKAAILIGFALFAAGPLGVSFGGIGTAALKLAAIAIFADGVIAWADYGVARISGMGGGILGSAITFPLILGIYWVLLIYLFSMDSGDSWMVVCILSALDMIVRMALVMIILNLVLTWGGAAASALPNVGSGPVTSLSRQVDDWNDTNQLIEAKEFVASGHQAVLGGFINQLYSAGCPKVWFQVDRDINGRAEPNEIVVEMPRDKEKRTRAYQIVRDYYKANDLSPGPEIKTDDGSRYIEVDLRD